MNQVQEFFRKFMELRQTHPRIWWWVKDFGAGILITMLGVFLAFWIDGCTQKHSLNQTTKRKLYNAYRESESNAAAIKEIYDTYYQNYTKQSKRVSFSYPTVTLAKIALQDENLPALKSTDTMIVLQMYILAVENLVRIMEFYQTPALQVDWTTLQYEVAAMALANCRLVSEVFEEYGTLTDKELDNLENHLEQRDKLYKEILEGEPYKGGPDD